MLLRPSVLCPIDFSEASRGALRYAAAIAEHFYAGLTVLAVDELAGFSGVPVVPGDAWPTPLTRNDVEQFVHDTFHDRPLAVPVLEFATAAGKPAPAILRFAAEHAPDLIVMSTHGITGIRKVLFGSTTERVLRETTVPVLATPPDEHGPSCLEELKTAIRRVLVPVDLTAATPRQVHIACGLAEAFDATMLLLHVIEPPRTLPRNVALLPRIQTAQLDRVQPALTALSGDVPARLRAEVITRYGDPAGEIATVAEERDADVIVMGLHSSPAAGPRMGSVTHRVLCQHPRLLLALPPAVDRRLLDRRQQVPESLLAAARA